MARASVASAASIADLKAVAERRLPSFAFTYLDEGAGNDAGVLRNRRAFDERLLVPRRLRSAQPQFPTTIFGRLYDLPFGIAPVGLADLAWPGTDVALAGLAARAKVPYVLSTAATTAIEDIARIAPGVTWFQLYPARDEAITQDLMQRAARGGVEVLVLTIDVPRSARRHRSIQQRVVVPFRFTPDVLLQIALHPRWALETLRAGPPQLRNFAPYVTSTSVQHVGRVMSQFNKPGLDWSDLKRIRDGWKGRLVAKGIMHPDDAVAAVEAGADGIWVSNHGGRQLPSMPASFDMLESVRRAVPREVPVFLDGGVMSGESVAKALGAGADMVFCGRAFIYGAAAGGKAGVEKAFEILSAELSDTLAQIGCGSVVSIREHLQPSARALRAAVGADFIHQEE